MSEANKPISVLYVEDDAFVASEIVRELRACGYEDIAHHSTWSATQACLAKRTFDVALLDIDLGQDERVDGIDIGAILLAKHGIPAVYLTNHSDDWVVQRLSAQPHAYYADKMSSGKNVATLLRLAHAAVPQHRPLAPPPPGQLNARRQEAAFPKNGRVRERLEFADLLYLKTEDAYTVAHLRGEHRTVKKALSMTLAEAMEMFERDDIVQVSRTVAVPHHAVAELHSDKVKLSSGEEIVVGRAFKEGVRGKLC